MSSLLKLAVATVMITATVGLTQAQVPQGRSIEVLPAAAENQADSSQTVAQAEAPAAPEAPAAEAPAAPEAAPEPAPPAQAAPQVAPQVPPAARAERLPVRPIPSPAPRQVEKCHGDKPVYGHYAPRYGYAPQQTYGGYGYRRGY